MRGLVASTLALLGCHGTTLSAPCGGPSPFVSTDWRAQVDELVATAPADSAVTIDVFIHPLARSGFFAWADSVGVTLVAVSSRGSAATITTVVARLPGLKDIVSPVGPGILDIGWPHEVSCPLTEEG